MERAAVRREARGAFGDAKLTLQPLTRQEADALDGLPWPGRQRPFLTGETPTIRLARLEAALDAQGGSLVLVTQNIDDLHERAGSRKLIHMHGELLKARCEGCGSVAPWREDLDEASRCPACGGSGAMRPHVVWFGEMPFAMERIEVALSRCDLFVSIGTSGNVYPAAGFVEAARAAGAGTVELNLEPSAGSRRFAEAVHGPAGTIVPAFVERVLAAAQ
jgi:NAD-dependent deacetylase